MQAITIPDYAPPSGYQISTVPRPTITEPTDVLIEVYAASVNPIDVKKASGALKLVASEEFPYKIGYDCSGVVIEVGKDVARFKVGDEVYTRLPEASRGAWSEYAKCAERYVATKPKNLSFEDAAAIPLAAMTAFQALKKYNGSLEGKTVFVPAGLSGTGSYACQLAKNVFKAGKVITTVSTAKVPRVPELLGQGVVDEVIDYTKQPPTSAIPARSVDFCFDTTGEAMSFLPLMVPNTSVIISIATVPSGTQLQNGDTMRRPNNPKVPILVRTFLNASDSLRRFRAKRSGVSYSYLFLDPNAEDLETLRQNVEEGRLRPVIGTRVQLRDLDKLKEACDQVYRGKGGIGKTVFVVKDGVKSNT